MGVRDIIILLGIKLLIFEEDKFSDIDKNPFDELEEKPETNDKSEVKPEEKPEEKKVKSFWDFFRRK